MVRMLSSEGFVTLIWASAALATPLVTEPIESHDLEVRQSSLEAREGTSNCPSTYESMNGLNFTIICDKNNPFNDAWPSFETPTLNDCLEHCSRFWGKQEGCFGVVWTGQPGRQCWIRNSTTSTKGLEDQVGTISAFVEEGDMKGYDTDCPAPDLSTKTLGNIGYTVHCNKDIGANDVDWRGYPSINASPFIAFYHATSLENCLGYCIKEHPLCQAVVYNPGLEMGFANCWPKAAWADPLLPPGPGRGVVHAATITSLDITSPNPVDTSCPKDSTYTAPGNKHFDIVCGKVNGGTNITSIHERNMTACLDACAASDQKCVGVVFDASFQQGYENCYLKNTTSIATDQSQASYAVLNKNPSSPSASPSASPSSSATPSPSPTGNPDPPPSSSSKGWIAGVVIGILAIVAIIGFALFWWRRRKARAVAGPGAIALHEKDGFGAAPAYYSPGAYQQMYSAHHSPGITSSELGGAAATEMPTTEFYKEPAKFAHVADVKSAGTAVAPQELPS